MVTLCIVPVEELSLELPPAVNEAVPRKDGLKAGAEERTGFDELEQAGLPDSDQSMLRVVSRAGMDTVRPVCGQ